VTMPRTRRAAVLLGTCMLVAVGAASGGAVAAPAKNDQTIAVSTHAPSVGPYSTAFTVHANASSNLEVAYSASGACSNVGDRFTMTSGTGTCLVKYDQAGDANYNPAPQVVESVTAQKADQEIFFDPLEDVTFGDLDYDIAGAFASSDLDVTLAATGKCTIKGVTVHLTGRDPLYEDVGGSSGPSLLLEILIGGIGALLVLLFVFGTLPAVVVPLLVAATSILTTFSLIWALTYVTDVSIIVQYLVALVGLGVAIDYSLLMIFRFREELHHGRDAESAIVETMTHAGRSVIVSGSTIVSVLVWAASGVGR